MEIREYRWDLPDEVLAERNTGGFDSAKHGWNASGIPQWKSFINININ